MGELLLFVFGLVIGGLVGVTIMCCFVINKLDGNEYDGETFDR